MIIDYTTITKIKIASEIMRDGFTMQDIIDFLIAHGIGFQGGENSSKKWAVEESLRAVRGKNILEKFFTDLLNNQYWSYKKPVRLLKRFETLIQGNTKIKARQKNKSATTAITIDSLHQKIKKASKKLFEDGHYSSAIFEACKALKSEVQRVSGLEDIDGIPLMQAAFSPGNPRIRFSLMHTKTEKDEQRGFMDLFAGVMGGIRNPRGHDDVLDKQPIMVLEALSLISFLMKKLDNRIPSEVVN